MRTVGNMLTLVIFSYINLFLYVYQNFTYFKILVLINITSNISFRTKDNDVSAKVKFKGQTKIIDVYKLVSRGLSIVRLSK